MEAILKKWKSIFAEDNIADVGLNGQVSSLRSFYWKVYLEYLPNLNHEAYKPMLQKERTGYDDLRKRFIFDPTKVVDNNLTVNNPLSLEQESPWSKYFQDIELQKIILQDVERAFPEQALFRKSSIKQIMCDILFIWCKVNPELAYRQGMHELLAFIVSVVDQDKLDPLDYSDYPSTRSTEEILDVFDGKHVEHDSFVLFSRLMRNAKVWYELAPHHTKSNPTPSSLSPRTGIPVIQNFIPVVQVCNKIQNEYVKALDFELYQHLEKINIEPQLYGIRWLRLLFGREFSFPDLAIIWDGIFAADPNLSLVEWVCVAMLIYLRDDIIGSEFAESIEVLMRFPTSEKLTIPASEFIIRAQGYRSKFEEVITISRSNSFENITLPVSPILPAIPSSSTTKKKRRSFSSVSPRLVSSSLDPLKQPQAPAISTNKSPLLSLLSSTTTPVTPSAYSGAELTEMRAKLRDIHERDRMLAKLVNNCIGELSSFVTPYTPTYPSDSPPPRADSIPLKKTPSHFESEKLNTMIKNVLGDLKFVVEELTTANEKTHTTMQEDDQGNQHLVDLNTTPSNTGRQSKPASSSPQNAGLEFSRHSAIQPIPSQKNLGSGSISSSFTSINPGELFSTGIKSLKTMFDEAATNFENITNLPKRMEEFDAATNVENRSNFDDPLRKINKHN